MKREDYGLGALKPPDRVHIETYPHVLAGLSPPAIVETTLALSSTLQSFYNQGSRPACTGFSQAIAASIYGGNKEQFDGRELWKAAQALEGVNNDNQGAYVRDAFSVVMNRGPKELKPSAGIDVGDGVSAYYWCSSSSQIREALGAGRIVVFGLDWFRDFDSPQTKHNERWIGLRKDLGPSRGGHAICATRWSDKRQAVQLTNSWGGTYKPVWLSATVIDKYLAIDWEAGWGAFRGA